MECICRHAGCCVCRCCCCRCCCVLCCHHPWPDHSPFSLPNLTLAAFPQHRVLGLLSRIAAWYVERPQVQQEFAQAEAAQQRFGSRPERRREAERMAAELAAQPGAPLCPCGCGQVGVAVASCCRMCVARWQSASGGSQGGFMNRARLQPFRPAWQGQWWCTHGPFVPTQCMLFCAAANSDGCCPAEGRLPHVARHRAAGQQRLALQRRGGGPLPPPPACARSVCAGDGRGAGRGRMQIRSGVVARNQSAHVLPLAAATRS